jgi:GTP-binding protein
MKFYTGGDSTLNINNAKFEITAVSPTQYPSGNVPEVAFVGRSNVGKSSIINALLNRKNLARVGAEPGRTREINFYNIDNCLYFVDLPGYGYASVSKGKKKSWSDIVETYLCTRQNIKLIIMMVDIRHSPSNEDKIMYEWLLSHDMPHLVVASKSDKIPRGQIKGRLQEITKVLGTGEGIVTIPFSSETKYGKDELWSHLESLAAEG